MSTPEGLEKAVRKAAKIIRTGGLVSCPTESFYGLAVDAASNAAIQRLFQTKRREATDPILLLIPGKESLQEWVTRVPPVARKLIDEFWPGGLTLVFEAGPSISRLLTAGTGKIGLRLSSHPAATALARAVRGPISGTSANLSGRPPCRTAQEVLQAFGNSVDLILDGGEPTARVGSTVLDVTVDPPRILREGMVDRRSLEMFVSVQP